MAILTDCFLFFRHFDMDLFRYLFVIRDFVALLTVNYYTVQKYRSFAYEGLPIHRIKFETIDNCQ